MYTCAHMFNRYPVTYSCNNCYPPPLLSSQCLKCFQYASPTWSRRLAKEGKVRCRKRSNSCLKNSISSVCAVVAVAKKNKKKTKKNKQKNTLRQPNQIPPTPPPLQTLQKTLETYHGPNQSIFFASRWIAFVFARPPPLPTASRPRRRPERGEWNCVN